MTKATLYLRFLIPAFILFALIAYISYEYKNRNVELPTRSLSLEKIVQQSSAPVYNYKILRLYTHSMDAFTEGLVFENGSLYESTGLYQQSSLRKVDLVSARILQEYLLPAKYFGEGLALIGEQLYQLTYQERTGFVYDKSSLQLNQVFHYRTEGWGLTTDGRQLIMSDGTALIYYLDPKTFKITRSILVHDGENAVTSVNGLGYINGKIYANIWPTNFIAIISVDTGEVEGWIDIKALNPYPRTTNTNYVANGIAYNDQDKTILITGKFWPQIFAIQLVKRA